MPIGFRAPAFRPTGNRDIDVFQREAADALQVLQKDPLLSFTERKNVNIGTSNTRVAHGLGRVPVGWIMTDRTGLGQVYRVSWDSQFVTFVSSTLVTVSIRFF